jgi:hypothetical protein
MAQSLIFCVNLWGLNRRVFSSLSLLIAADYASIRPVNPPAGQS